MNLELAVIYNADFTHCTTFASKILVSIDEAFCFPLQLMKWGYKLCSKCELEIKRLGSQDCCIMAKPLDAALIFCLGVPRNYFCIFLSQIPDGASGWQKMIVKAFRNLLSMTEIQMVIQAPSFSLGHSWILQVFGK